MSDLSDTSTTSLSPRKGGNKKGRSFISRLPSFRRKRSKTSDSSDQDSPVKESKKKKKTSKKLNKPETMATAFYATTRFTPYVRPPGSQNYKGPSLQNVQKLTSTSERVALYEDRLSVLKEEENRSNPKIKPKIEKDKNGSSPPRVFGEEVIAKSSRFGFLGGSRSSQSSISSSSSGSVGSVCPINDENKEPRDSPSVTVIPNSIQPSRLPTAPSVNPNLVQPSKLPAPSSTTNGSKVPIYGSSASRAISSSTANKPTVTNGGKVYMKLPIYKSVFGENTRSAQSGTDIKISQKDTGLKQVYAANSVSAVSNPASKLVKGNEHALDKPKTGIRVDDPILPTNKILSPSIIKSNNEILSRGFDVSNRIEGIKKIDGLSGNSIQSEDLPTPPTQSDFRVAIKGMATSTPRHEVPKQNLVCELNQENESPGEELLAAVRSKIEKTLCTGMRTLSIDDSCAKPTEDGKQSKSDPQNTICNETSSVKETQKTFVKDAKTPFKSPNFGEVPIPIPLKNPKISELQGEFDSCDMDSLASDDLMCDYHFLDDEEETFLSRSVGPVDNGMKSRLEARERSASVDTAIEDKVEKRGSLRKKKKETGTYGSLPRITKKKEELVSSNDTLDELNTLMGNDKYTQRFKQLHLAARGRSYSTPSSFRPPRHMSMPLDDADAVEIDTHSYRQLVGDVTGVKTMLLRLKRMLQNADTMSPFDPVLKAMSSATSSPYGSEPTSPEGKKLPPGYNVDILFQENQELRYKKYQLECQEKDWIKLTNEKDKHIKNLQDQVRKLSEQLRKETSDTGVQTDIQLVCIVATLIQKCNCSIQYGHLMAIFVKDVETMNECSVEVF
ncbi:uncharacterized protein LOC100371016 [Saccoglossus kowalevskii]|uniref:Flocculation protein FLO11-like n=1 Tax=Saccoglossus kowalevskii TaxID=10224 RepID=A0ABM0MKH6_SACKO|nr:PREDICTED: flocculation protein FLO11-like [Saccoglossus kowalevskii]